MKPKVLAASADSQQRFGLCILSSCCSVVRHFQLGFMRSGWTGGMAKKGVWSLLYNFSQMALRERKEKKTSLTKSHLPFSGENSIPEKKTTNSHYNRDLREQFRLKMPSLAVQLSVIFTSSVRHAQVIPANVECA